MLFFKNSLLQEEKQIHSNQNELSSWCIKLSYVLKVSLELPLHWN